MRGMNSACVDLIYLDPPFNSKANYAAPIGSKAAGAEFKDTWTLKDVDIAWLDLIEAKHKRLNNVIRAAMTRSDKSYLIYMAVRLLEMHRILKPTGSIYLHCDPTMSHYLKLLMDAVFGKGNFRNEVVWCYSLGGRSKVDFARKHDVVLRYGKTNDVGFNADAVRISRPKTHMKIETDTEGQDWQIKKDAKSGKIYRYPVKAGALCPDWWIGIEPPNRSSKERIGYPTQKPLKLLDRILKASSNEGDVVLDPFCGCATACIASEKLQRQWVGIDVSSKAAELVRVRMRDEIGLFYSGAHRTDIPHRTDLGKIEPYNNGHNKKHLYGEQGGSCNGCSEHFKPQNLTIDHIIPRAKGGQDHLTNLQLLCGYCNSVKGDRGMEYLIAKLAA